ncbi:MAG: FtsX-like permease family protein [Lachnospiraceae bacterium]|nr:FtsX-like permease family protein [Lachnospiraceae bacterium]
MNCIKTIFEMTKKRIINTPVTSVFLMIGLILSMLTISICVSFISEYAAAQEAREDAKPPNGQQYVLSMETDNDVIDFQSIFENIRQDSGVVVNGIMVHIEESDVNTFSSLSGEWFISDETWHYPLVEGRYYTAKEVASGEKVVLIGKNYKQYTYEENGKEYIDIEEEKYQVLGVVGLEKQLSAWDSRLFMPCTSLPDAVMGVMSSKGYISCILHNYNGNMIVDEQQIRSNLFNISQSVEFTYAGEIQTEDITMTLMSNGDMIITIAAVGYFVSLVYAINIVVFWVENRKKEIAIRKAVGFKNSDIAKLLMSEMIGLSALSCVIAIFIQCVLQIFMDTFVGYNLKIYISNIVIGVVVVFFTAAITSIMPIRKLLKIQPIEAMKR